PEAEPVLVMRRIETRRDERAVRGSDARRDGAGRDDPRELDLRLDRAVLIEVPEEAVLVVADRSDRRHDESPGAPHLDLAGTKVGVLPQNTEVFLVQADRVAQRERLALRVGADRIQAANLPEAGAAERQRVGQHAHAVLALVEGILAPVRRTWIAVGNDHLGERGAVENRAQASLVLVGDRVKHETLTRCEADAQAPLLPSHLVAPQLEARAVALHD